MKLFKNKDEVYNELLRIFYEHLNYTGDIAFNVILAKPNIEGFKLYESLDLKTKKNIILNHEIIQNALNDAINLQNAVNLVLDKALKEINKIEESFDEESLKHFIF